MSLRSYNDQCDLADDDDRAFRARLGPALPAFETMTVDRVVARQPCELHKAAIGASCGTTPGGTVFACIDRRIAAAILSL